MAGNDQEGAREALSRRTSKHVLRKRKMREEVQAQEQSLVPRQTKNKSPLEVAPRKTGG